MPTDALPRSRRFRSAITWGIIGAVLIWASIAASNALQWMPLTVVAAPLLPVTTALRAPFPTTAAIIGPILYAVFAAFAVSARTRRSIRIRVCIGLVVHLATLAVSLSMPLDPRPISNIAPFEIVAALQQHWLDHETWPSSYDDFDDPEAWRVFLEDDYGVEPNFSLDTSDVVALAGQRSLAAHGESPPLFLMTFPSRRRVSHDSLTSWMPETFLFWLAQHRSSAAPPASLPEQTSRTSSLPHDTLQRRWLRHLTNRCWGRATAGTLGWILYRALGRRPAPELETRWAASRTAHYEWTLYKAAAHAIARIDNLRYSP